MEIAWHPLDDSGFREWLRDEYDENYLSMAYGIYDSGWMELYEQYEDDVKYREEQNADV
jgi:hypothetical protein